MVQATTSSELLKVFRTTLGTPEGRWESARAFAKLALRSERDAGMEVGRLICKRVVSDIDIVLKSAPLFSSGKSSDYVDGPAVSSKRVLDTAVAMRRMASPVQAEISSAIENDSLQLSSDLIAAGTARTNVEEVLGLVGDALDAWDDLVEAVDGAKRLIASLDSMPADDLGYFAHRLANWNMRGAWDVATKGQNDQAINSVLSSSVFVRLARKKVSPDLVVGTTTGFQGKCDPGLTTGHRSGPFGIVNTTNTLPVRTEHSTPIPQTVIIPDKPATSFFVGMAKPDGNYYVPGVLPNIPYTLKVAVNKYPDSTISVTFASSGAFGIITAESLRDAINAAGAIGITASVVIDPVTGNKQVRVDCSVLTGQVFGPPSWVRFYDFSDNLLTYLGFPSVIFPDQVSFASDVAREINQLLARGKATSEMRHLARGDRAISGYPTDGDIALTKGMWGCVVESDGKIVPSSLESLSSIEVGDECYVLSWNSSTATTVSDVVDDGFYTDPPTLNPTILAFTINPPVVNKDRDVGVALLVDGRYIYSDDIHHDNLGVLYIQNTNYHYYLGSGQITGPFRLVQDILRIQSHDTTTASMAAINHPQVPSLDAEAQFDYDEHLATAYELIGDFTAVDGFNSQVRIGDLVPSRSKYDPDHVVVETHDGYVRFNAGFDVSSGPLNIINAPYYAWTQLLSSLSLPLFDSTKARNIVNAYQVEKNLTRIGTELSNLISPLYKVLPILRAAAQSFVDASFQARQMTANLLALRQNADVVYDRLQKGDLSGFSLPARETTTTSTTALRSSNMARSVKMNLTMIEFLAVGMGD